MRLENLVEQNKVVANENLLAARIATLEKRATDNGIKVFKRHEDRPATAFGERRMSEVEVFSRYVEP